MHKIETRLLPISEMRLKSLFLNLILTGLISVTSGHGTTTTTTTTTARAVERSCTDYAVQVCTSLELVVLAHSVTRLGDFYLLRDKFSYKSIPNIMVNFGLFYIIQFS